MAASLWTVFHSPAIYLEGFVTNGRMCSASADLQDSADIKRSSSDRIIAQGPGESNLEARAEDSAPRRQNAPAFRRSHEAETGVYGIAREE
jgi:hypothetical protein